MLEYSNNINNRKKEILNNRIGLSGERQTLEEIGIKLGVTRERARQIESFLIQNIIKTDFFLFTKSQLKQLLSSRNTPLFLDLIGVDSSWFYGFENNLQSLSNLIESLFNNELKILTIDGRFVISTLDIDDWIETRKEIIIVLKELLPNKITKDDVLLVIESSMSAKGAPELSDAMFNDLKNLIHFSEIEKKAILTSVGKGFLHIIEAFLLEAKRPYHYKAIAKICSKKCGKRIGYTQANGLLQRLNAKYFGRGLYGAIHHMPFSDEKNRAILMDIEKIIENGPKDKQWSCHELLSALKRTKLIIPNKLNTYHINIILENSIKLRPLGRMVWTNLEKDNANRKERIEIMQACADILIKAGRPLTNKDIVERLSKIRGIGKNICYKPTNRVARIAPGKWGLIDRDFHLDKKKIKEIKKVVFQYLESQSNTIHYKFIKRILKNNGIDIPNKITDYMIFGLLQSDGEVKTLRGREITLKKNKINA